MRTISFSVYVVLIVACHIGASGEEIVYLTRRNEADHFKADSVRLTESQAMAIGKINTNLDLDAHIDVIETPFDDALRHLGSGAA